MSQADAANKASPENAREPAPPRAEGEEQTDAPRNTRRREIGGAQGPEPTRYGDWERNGRCTDF